MSILTRSCRVQTSDERRAAWSFAYYSAGHHRRDRKPRIRVKPRIRIINTPTMAGKGISHADHRV